MKLSIIIVSWKVKDFLYKCLFSIKEHIPASISFEVILVDNNSADGTVEMVKTEFPWVRLIASKENLGFARGNNLAFEQATGEYFFLLNPDTQLKEFAIERLLSFMDKNVDIAAVGPKLLNTDGSLQPSCKAFPKVSTLIFQALFLDKIFPKSKTFGSYEMSWWDHSDTREVDQPMGAALLVRKKVVDTIGPMDENFYMFFDEVDWCYRMKKLGYKIFFLDNAEIVHHGGRSIKSAELRMSYHWHKSLKNFFKKHYHLPGWFVNLLIVSLFAFKILIGVLIIKYFISNFV